MKIMAKSKGRRNLQNYQIKSEDKMIFKSKERKKAFQQLKAQDILACKISVVRGIHGQEDSVDQKDVRFVGATCFGTSIKILTFLL